MTIGVTKHNNTAGFTMIELLMVIMIVAVLSATALPQFLDFRKEARVAVLRSNLSAMRAGVKNQLMQIKLRCNNFGNLQALNSFGVNSLLRFQLWNGDITTMSGGEYQVCSTSEIPNLEERKFWQALPESQSAKAFDGGEDEPSGLFFPFPENPFATERGNAILGSGFGYVEPLDFVDATVQSSMSRCAWVDSLLSLGTTNTGYSIRTRQISFPAQTRLVSTSVTFN